MISMLVRLINLSCLYLGPDGVGIARHLEKLGLNKTYDKCQGLANLESQNSHHSAHILFQPFLEKKLILFQPFLEILLLDNHLFLHDLVPHVLPITQHLEIFPGITLDSMTGTRDTLKRMIAGSFQVFTSLFRLVLQSCVNLHIQNS